MTTQEILKSCTVSRNVVSLPNVRLERKEYEDVKKALTGIGGKWVGGKTQGFVFATDPTALLEKISGGEKINLKKDFQFFGTPPHLADRLVELAEINPHGEILEPSAGQGAIVEAIARKFPDIFVYCCELMEQNRIILEKNPNAMIVCNDFMHFPLAKKFERIIANPPFSNNQDIDHIKKMYSLLKNHGRLVTIASVHWRHSSNKKETEFREWLNKVDAEVLDIPRGEFKKSGTGVQTCIIVINKNA